MVPRLLIDRSAIPGEGGELRLMQRGSEFSIMLGNNELMNSRLSGSEEALATLSCGKILPRPQPQMLIGGLGMGITIRAPLVSPRSDASIPVSDMGPDGAVCGHGPTDHHIG